MHSKNVQAAITHLFDAFNDQDLELAMAGYSPDVEFIMHSGGRALKGVAAIHEMFGALFASGAPLKAVIDEIFDAGDVVTFKFTMEGVNPQTGKPTRTRCCDIVKFDAQGRIVREDNYSGKSEELAA